MREPHRPRKCALVADHGVTWTLAFRKSKQSSAPFSYISCEPLRVDCTFVALYLNEDLFFVKFQTCFKSKLFLHDIDRLLDSPRLYSFPVKSPCTCAPAAALLRSVTSQACIPKIRSTAPFTGWQSITAQPSTVTRGEQNEKIKHLLNFKINRTGGSVSTVPKRIALSKDLYM